MTSTLKRIPFEGEFSDEEFVEYLRKKILKISKKNIFVVFSEANHIAVSLSKKLLENGHSIRLGAISLGNVKVPELAGISYFKSFEEAAGTAAHVDAIIATSTKNSEINRAYYEVSRVPALRQTLFFFKIRGSDTYPLLNEQDQWKELGVADSHVFITNQFDDGLFEEIYRYTLTKVERKCQIRDALDLFQCLKHAERIEGAIVEFGSYRGHSGLLMAEFIKRSGLSKMLYLCDTFEGFPEEDYGIDKEWSNTHFVDFTHIKKLFEPYDFVKLMKGEFQQTVDQIPAETISLPL